MCGKIGPSIKSYKVIRWFGRTSDFISQYVGQRDCGRLTKAIAEVESPLFEVLTEHIHNDNTNAPWQILCVAAGC